MELMQKHWVLILHLKTKYINRCQFIWWTIRQRLLAFLSLSSIAPPEINFSLCKSYFQIANSPIKEKKQKPKGNDLKYLIYGNLLHKYIKFCFVREVFWCYHFLLKVHWSVVVWSLMVTVAFCLSEMDWLLDLDLSNLEVMKATVRDCQCYRHRPSFWSDRLRPGLMPDGLMTDSNRKWNLLPLYCHFPLDKFSKGNVLFRIHDKLTLS